MAAHAQPRNGSAAVVAILLMGLGLAAAWWAMAPVVLGVDTGTVLEGAPLAPAAIVATRAIQQGSHGHGIGKVESQRHEVGRGRRGKGFGYPRDRFG